MNLRTMLGAALAALLLCGSAQAACTMTAMPYTFVNGTVADANQVNSNFSSVISQTNSFYPLVPTCGGTYGLSNYNLIVGQGGSSPAAALGSTGTAGQILLSAGAAALPTWGPATGTSGQFLMSQGASAPIWGPSVGTTGQLLIQGASAPVWGATPGGAGQVLTSNGAGVAPTFQTPSSNVALIQTTAASSTTTIAFTGINGTYSNFTLDCYSLVGTSAIGIQIGEGGGPTWETTGSYAYAGLTIQSSSVTGFGSQTGTSIQVSGGNGASEVQASLANIAAGVNKQIQFRSSISSSPQLAASGAGAWIGDTNAITAIRITSGTNITAGSCSLYGVPT